MINTAQSDIKHIENIKELINDAKKLFDGMIKSVTVSKLIKEKINDDTIKVNEFLPDNIVLIDYCDGTREAMILDQNRSIKLPRLEYKYLPLGEKKSERIKIW